MTLAELDKLDDKLNYKRVRIRINSSKSILTPLKATNFLNPVSNINEIYKEFNLDSLIGIGKSEKREREKNGEIKGLKTEGLNFFFLNYVSEQIPDEKHLETLADLQYPHSDIVIPPIFSRVVNTLEGEELLNNFLDLTNTSLEIAGTLNKKPIMGIIPAVMPRQFLETIIKNYINQGVNSFAVDFNGRSMDTNMSWARTLMRLMAKYELSENSFLYAINCHEGRFIKKSDKILAKDFISIGCGIDVLGLNHTPPRMSSQEWLNLKNKRKDSLYRVFDRKDYAYTKTSESELRGTISGNIRNEIKRQNMQSQYEESTLLQQKIEETKTIEPYLETKEKVTPELIKNMEILRNEAFSSRNHKKLDNWFD